MWRKESQETKKRNIAHKGNSHKGVKNQEELPEKGHDVSPVVEIKFVSWIGTNVGPEDQ
jgi:hypothetical protein